MLIVQTRTFPLIKTSEVWFYKGASIAVSGKMLFNQSEVKPEGNVFMLAEFHTLALPLTETSEQLFDRINRTFRYHIRKGEGLELEFTQLDFNDENSLPYFVRSFNEFARRKKLIRLPMWRAKALAKSEGLTVTALKRGKRYINMHAYLHDGTRARLMTSHPVEQAESESMQGYINKYHHWRDILYFKDKDYRWYDFGGIAPGSEDGRSYFKQSFGGEHQVFYNYIRSAGPATWLFTLKKLYEKFA